TGEIQESLRGAFPVFEYEQTDALFLGADVFASYLLPYGLEYSIKGSLLRAEDTNRESNLSMIPSNRLDNQIRYNLSGIELSESFLQIQYSTVFKQSRYNKEADFLEAP